MSTLRKALTFAQLHLEKRALYQALEHDRIPAWAMAPLWVEAFVLGFVISMVDAVEAADAHA